MSDKPPYDPTFLPPTIEEAQRCVKLANRIGCKAEIVKIPFKSDETKHSYAIQVPAKYPTKENPFVLLKSVNVWRNWLDDNLWLDRSSPSMWWDRFIPSLAKFKEKEIHKWIKEYKEID